MPFKLTLNSAIRETDKMMGIPFSEDRYQKASAELTIEVTREPTKEEVLELIAEYQRLAIKEMPKKGMHFVSLEFKSVELVLE